MADPYSILGIARGASEQDIKSAYRKLAKQLHPDANKDNPGAADRFSQVTQAYDLLSDKDKRAKFDRGEIDMDGNPKMPFGYGQRGGGQYRQAGGNPFGGMGGASTDDVDLSDLFEGIFGGGGQRRSRGGMGGGMGGGAQDNPFVGMGGGFGGGQQRRPVKGANVNYRLAVSLTDIANLEKQRITLADGKTIDLKLPAGAEDGTPARVSSDANSWFCDMSGKRCQEISSVFLPSKSRSGRPTKFHSASVRTSTRTASSSSARSFQASPGVTSPA